MVFGRFTKVLLHHVVVSVGCDAAKVGLVAFVCAKHRTLRQTDSDIVSTDASMTNRVLDGTHFYLTVLFYYTKNPATCCVHLL